MRKRTHGEKELISNTDKMNSGVRMPRSNLILLDGLDIKLVLPYSLIQILASWQPITFHSHMT